MFSTLSKLPPICFGTYKPFFSRSVTQNLHTMFFCWQAHHPRQYSVVGNLTTVEGSGSSVTPTPRSQPVEDILNSESLPSGSIYEVCLLCYVWTIFLQQGNHKVGLWKCCPNTAGKHSSGTLTHICLESCVHRCPALWILGTTDWLVGGLVEFQSEELTPVSVGVRRLCWVEPVLLYKLLKLDIPINWWSTCPEKLPPTPPATKHNCSELGGPRARRAWPWVSSRPGVRGYIILLRDGPQLSEIQGGRDTRPTSEIPGAKWEPLLPVSCIQGGRLHMKSKEEEGSANSKQ